MSEHLLSSGELLPNAKFSGAPNDLLDHAKTCKKTLRVRAPDCFLIRSLFRTPKSCMVDSPRMSNPSCAVLESRY